MSNNISHPRIEDYLRLRATERRAHVLDDKGIYRIFSSIGMMPYGGVLGSVLPDYSEHGTLMWVDFRKYTQTGVSPEGRPTVRSRAIGETAIAIEARNFATAEEIIEEDLGTDYMEDWLVRYCGDRTRNSFKELRHPIIEPIKLLDDYLRRRGRVK